MCDPRRGFDRRGRVGYTATMLPENAADLLARFDRVTPADGDELAELSKERGWVEAIRYFAERGMLTPAGEAEAAQILAASNEWADGLSTDELVLPPPDTADAPAISG